MKRVSRHPELDAPASRSGSGRAPFHALILAGIVAFALLLVGEPPRGPGSPVFGGRAGPAALQAQMITLETARSADHGAALILAETDDAVGDPWAVEPVAGPLPRHSATGFRPAGDAPSPTQDAGPPDRPPRNV